jgi:hypothetical protein
MNASNCPRTTYIKNLLAAVDMALVAFVCFGAQYLAPGRQNRHAVRKSANETSSDKVSQAYAI